MHFLRTAFKESNRAPKRTKTCIECNNIVTTKQAKTRCGRNTHTDDFDLSETRLKIIISLKCGATFYENYQERLPRLARAGGWRCSFRAANPPHAPQRLEHGRSVPLAVALGGNDYAFVPPAAPSSRTARLFILVVQIFPSHGAISELSEQTFRFSS